MGEVSIVKWVMGKGSRLACLLFVPGVEECDGLSTGLGGVSIGFVSFYRLCFQIKVSFGQASVVRTPGSTLGSVASLEPSGHRLEKTILGAKKEPPLSAGALSVVVSLVRRFLGAPLPLANEDENNEDDEAAELHGGATGWKAGGGSELCARHGAETWARHGAGLSSDVFVLSTFFCRTAARGSISVQKQAKVISFCKGEWPGPIAKPTEWSSFSDRGCVAEIEEPKESSW